MNLRMSAAKPVLILLCLAAWAAPARAAENFLPESAAFTAEETWVPLRDGKRLAADVYLPKSAKGALPTILIQTPYTKASSRAGFGVADGARRHPLAGTPAYAIVIVDWRGRGESKDAFTPESFPGGEEDGFDTLEWVAAQPWCDGKIGTWGPSALGRVQYQTLRAGHPNHLCAVPFVMPMNLDYDSYFPGGALWEEFVAVLKRLGWDRRSWLVENPVNGEFWREMERTTFTKPSQMRVPMLIYGGWFDIYADGVIETFQKIRAEGGESARKHSRLLMGPWIHAGDEPAKQGELVFENAANRGAERAVEFFDLWLRGEKNDAESRAPVTYYQMGANEWRTSADWPPPGAQDVPYFLTAEMRLDPAAQGGEEKLEFKADPADPVPTVGGHLLDPALGRGPLDQRERVESRKDVLVFSSPVFGSDLAVAGRPRVALKVSTDGPDADFTALLTDVYPDGRSLVIAEGIRRLRFREGTDKEVMAEPGKAYEIEIALQSTAITFKKGHRARVIIAGSSSPHWAVNLNDGGKMYDGHTGRVATSALHVGGRSKSRLILPLVDE